MNPSDLHNLYAKMTELKDRLERSERVNDDRIENIYEKLDLIFEKLENF